MKGGLDGDGEGVYKRELTWARLAQGPELMFAWAGDSGIKMEAEMLTMTAPCLVLHTLSIFL